MKRWATTLGRMLLAARAFAARRSNSSMRTARHRGRAAKRVLTFVVPLCGIAAIIAAGAPGARAQGSRKDDVVFGPQGRPVAGATITVCTSTATGTPCSPLASLYTDATLTVSAPNPFTTDGLGNYHFYANPGRYQVQISGPGITTYTINDVILPNDPMAPSFSTVTSSGGISALTLTLGGNLTVAGSASVTGTLTAGTFAPSSLSVAGNANAKGPQPRVDAAAYGVKADSSTDDTIALQAAVTAVCSSVGGGGTLFIDPGLNGGYVRLTQTQTTVAGDSPFNRVAQVSIPSNTMVRTANSVVFTPGGTPFVVTGGPGTWYNGEGVTIAGATDSTFNGTWPIISTSSSSITFYQPGASLSNTTSGGGTATTNSPVIDLSLCAKNGTSIAIEGGNTYLGTSAQFSNAPQTSIAVQTSGASPNTAPVFLFTNAGHNLRNLTISGQNQAVQINNTVQANLDNVALGVTCTSGGGLGGVTDNVALAIYSSFWITFNRGTAKYPPGGACSTAPYSMVFANINNQNTTGLFTFDTLRIVGGMLFDERGGNSGNSCCTMSFKNISTENTNNTATLTLLNTGTIGQRSSFGGLYMENLIGADCSLGKGVVNLNAGSMNVNDAVLINTSPCGGGASAPGMLNASSTGKFYNTRIIGQAGAQSAFALDSSGNPSQSTTENSLAGPMVIADTSNNSRFRTDLPIKVNSANIPFVGGAAAVKPAFSAAPAGAGANVTVAMDPGVGTCGLGGFLMKGDAATLGFDTSLTMTADQQLSLCFGNLPPTNFALVGSTTGGTLSAGTYYYNSVTCPLNPCNGAINASAPTPETTCVIASGTTGSCAATWTVAAGPTVNGYLVCRGAATGNSFAGGGSCYKVNGGASASFTDTGAAADYTGVSLAFYNSSLASYHQFTPTAYTSATVHSVKRLKTNQGTPIANGNITLTAGWGSTAAVSAAAGYDQAFTFTVTANGTGIAANPTFTFVFNDGTWTNVPVFICKQVGGTGTLTTLSGEQAGSATTLGPVTFNGTPVSGSTYVINCVGFGK